MNGVHNVNHLSSGEDAEMKRLHGSKQAEPVTEDEEWSSGELGIHSAKSLSVTVYICLMNNS